MATGTFLIFFFVVTQYGRVNTELGIITKKVQLVHFQVFIFMNITLKWTDSCFEGRNYNYLIKYVYPNGALNLLLT